MTTDGRSVSQHDLQACSSSILQNSKAPGQRSQRSTRTRGPNHIIPQIELSCRCLVFPGYLASADSLPDTVSCPQPEHHAAFTRLEGGRFVVLLKRASSNSLENYADEPGPLISKASIPLVVSAKCRRRSMQVLEVQKETRVGSSRLVEETESHVVVGLLLLCSAQAWSAMSPRAIYHHQKTHPPPWPPPWPPQQHHHRQQHHRQPGQRRHRHRSRRWKGDPSRPCPREPVEEFRQLIVLLPWAIVSLGVVRGVGSGLSYLGEERSPDGLDLLDTGGLDDRSDLVGLWRCKRLANCLVTELGAPFRRGPPMLRAARGGASWSSG